MKLIIDTDSGTDNDDASDLAMIMNSPIDLIGVSQLTRARLAAGLLRIEGKEEVKIFAEPPPRSILTQAVRRLS
jgi:hypothetical protein